MIFNSYCLGVFLSFGLFFNVVLTKNLDSDSIVSKVRNISFGNTSPNMYHNISNLRQMSLTSNCGKIDQNLPKSKQMENNFLIFLKSFANLDQIAFVGEFPWMAAIIVKSKGQVFYCGAVLIDHLHILTSASCVARTETHEISRLLIILGVHDIYNPFEEGRVERGVSQIVLHKGFDPIHLENNIALIRLNKPVPYSNQIQPICLPDTNATIYQDQELVTLSGRGQLLFDPLKYLNKVRLKLEDIKKCSNKYKKETLLKLPRIGNHNLCAIAFSQTTNNNNLCLGNNGAPLIMKRHNAYQLIGITSWGIGVERYPCVFTRVDQFVPWIKQNINI